MFTDDQTSTAIPETSKLHLQACLGSPPFSLMSHNGSGLVHSRSVKQQLDRLQLQVYGSKSIPETLRDDFWNFKNKCADRCKPLVSLRQPLATQSCAARAELSDLCHASKGTQVMKPKPSDKSL